MDDAAIVALLLKGDPAGLAEAYRAYADRLFTYSVSLLHDQDGAADAVHDTFVIAAERIGQLRDPERLRPWLYAIARNECLRAARARRRAAAADQAALEDVAGVSDETTDLGADLRDEELRRLVWTAADGLNPREREVLELSVRHGLDGAAVGSAMGVPANHAHALTSKARQQLERALGALIVARTGRRDCSALDGLLADWDGRVSVLFRKRVARHIESCSACMERKRRDVSATALLGMAPLLAAPLVLRERVLGGLGDTRLVAQHSAVAARAGRFGRDGFPVPLDRRRPASGWLAPAVAAAAAAVLIVSGVILQGDRAGDALDTTVPPPHRAAPLRPTHTPPTTSAPTPSPTESVPESASDPPVETTTAPATSASPTPPPSESTSPPDLLSIYCLDDLTIECTDLTLTRNGGDVLLTTESDKPVTVMVTVPDDARWLIVMPEPPLTVTVDQPIRMHFWIGSAFPGCGPWTVSVDFEVIDVGLVKTLAIHGEPDCPE